MTNIANKIDKHVGGRVKIRRQELGFSQEKLGCALGITFQQVQKYEKGTNRISASRLQQIGAFLGVPVSYFFEGLNEKDERITGFSEEPTSFYHSDHISTEDGLRLIRAFLKVSDPNMRARLIELVEAMSVASSGKF